mmetsp:Transcript_22911/g.28880  ORF Transcript_22911/g.28880 Transcript_22911/m.28880 type:complete len:270 (+) Transcript_22911:382-1191(+)
MVSISKESIIISICCWLISLRCSTSWSCRCWCGSWSCSLVASLSSVVSCPLSTVVFTTTTWSCSRSSVVLLLLLMMLVSIRTIALGLAIFTKGLAVHNKLRRLLHDDSIDDLLYLLTSLSRSTDSCNTKHLARRWLRWDLYSSLCSLLHLSNNTARLANTHSNVLIGYLHLYTNSTGSLTSASIRSLIVVHLATENLFHECFGEVCSFHLRVCNVNSPDHRIVCIWPWRNLYVCAGSLLNLANVHSALTNHQPNIIVWNLHSDMCMALG